MRDPDRESVQDAAAAGHLPKKEDSACSEEDVGRPYGQKRGNPVLTAQGAADERQRVIEDDECEGSNHSGTLATSPRSHTQGNAHQHENKAGGRIGKALVDFYKESLAVRTVTAGL